MASELERWLQAGFIRRLSAAGISRARCISPAFVSYAAAKSRLVVDLREVNAHLEGKPFKYELLPEFIAMLRLNDHLVSWDIKDAYHHIFIHPDDRTYLTFTIDGGTYECVTMPFGLSVAPWAWTKVMRPVLAHLRRKGFTLIGYVDDHAAAPAGGRPTSAAEATAGFGYVTRLYDKLGLTLHPLKGEREGTTKLTLLGFTVDTANNWLSLPPARLAKVVGAARGLLAAARKNRRFVRLKMLQRVAGLAVSTLLAVPEARLFTRSLYDDARSVDPDDRSDRRLSHQSIRDLRFWANLTADGHGRPLWRPAEACTLHTDACDAGWGGGLTRDGRKYEARGFFSPEQRQLHINTKEVLAVRLSLESLEDLLAAGEVVSLFVDSQVALHVIEGLSSRSAPLLAELRRLHKVVQRLGVTLTGAWLPTAENAWADALSREEDNTDWTLARPFFASLEAMYGPHQVDRFATGANAQLPRYNSRWRDPGTEGVNALEQDWAGANNWVNPPFCLIPLVLRHLAAQRASATVIVPVWEAQPWWEPALRQANEVCYLPRAAGIFRHGAADRPASHPHWRVCALRFIRGGRRPPPPRGRGRAARWGARSSARAPAVTLPPSC